VRFLLNRLYNWQGRITQIRQGQAMTETKNSTARLGLLGYGEAGQAMAESLAARTGQPVTVYDRREIAAGAGAMHCADMAGLAASAEMIFSLVTADQSSAAAEALAPHLTDQHIVLDGNSVSPGTKKHNAGLLAPSRACYVDLAIMAPILPRGHRTPMLIAGPQQGRVAAMLEGLDFAFSWVDSEIGKASIVKMLRSILIKGAESIITEAVSAAEGLGIGDEILASAGKTLGIADLAGLADYMMERAALHGRRRAAEMREVAKTLEELGLSNIMASAIARHQDMIADMDLPASFADKAPPADRKILAPLIASRQKTG
jgi:3-hydroxyisobutyrate dehydrogenase-like beta-hydroxyacid dehydrogenase